MNQQARNLSRPQAERPTVTVYVQFIREGMVCPQTLHGFTSFFFFFFFNEKPCLFSWFKFSIKREERISYWTVSRAKTVKARVHCDGVMV